MTNPPPPIAEVPWSDADALHGWIASRPAQVTPLMLERLFDYRKLECVGQAPSRGSESASIWAPKDRLQLRNATDFTFVVYHSELVVEERVIRALRMLQALEWARRGRNDQGA